MTCQLLGSDNVCVDTKREVEPFGTWINLLQAQAVVTEALEARLEAQAGLSLAEHEALARVSSAPEGRLKMAELAGLMLVSKSGVTVADMANGPRQRIQPYPETVALLEMLGSRNSHKCVSC